MHKPNLSRAIAFANVSAVTQPNWRMENGDGKRATYPYRSSTQLLRNKGVEARVTIPYCFDRSVIYTSLTQIHPCN